MTARVSISFFPLLAALFVALSGCDRGPAATAAISYRQIGACNGFSTGGGAATRPNEAYVVFKIEGVDNTKMGSDWPFIPSRLYVDQSSEKQKTEWIGSWDRHFASSNPRFAQGLGVTEVTPASVPHGANMPTKGIVMVAVRTAKTNGADEANQTSYTLSYDAQPSDPGVVTSKTNAAQTTWPQTEDCKAIVVQ
jgi:hypothetical protein